MLWAVRTLLHDIKLIFAGIVNIVRYVREFDDVQASISIFSTPLHVVHEGIECWYDIVLANATPHDHFQKLLVDIYAKDHPVHPEGHYAYFAKNLLLTRRGSTAIRISYDWKNGAFFHIDGVPLSPDTFWRGECIMKEKYLIRATLFDIDDHPCEELTLVQKLTS